MSASHTPAPWAFERAVEANGSVTFDIFNSASEACNGVGGGVAYIQTYSAQQAAVQEANARLIAASPKLLAQLQSAINALDALTDKVDGTGFSSSDEFNHALDEISLGRAAIAQAVQP
jgi:hypothetical protein